MVAVCLATTCAAWGSITLGSIDILDSSDTGGPPPAGLLVIDTSIEVSENDRFVQCSIVGRTSHGASLVYAPMSDPNDVFLPPGSAQRFVTFGSAAYGRDDTARYSPSGTVVEPTIATSTAYESGAGLARFSSSEIDAVYFPTPPGGRTGEDGFVLRVALDISGVSIAGGQEAENYRIFTPGSEPPGYLPVFLSDNIRSDPPFGGIMVLGVDGLPGASGRDWGVYVPEPASATYLLVVAMAIVARRRLSTSK